MIKALQRFADWINRYIRPVCRIVWMIRFPFFVTALLCALFFVGQMLEILRVTAADRAEFNWRYWFGSVAAVFASLGAWYFSRLLLDLTQQARGNTAYERAFETQVPRFLGIAIPLSLALAGYGAMAPASELTKPINRNLTLFIWVEIAVAVVLYVFFFERRVYLNKKQKVAPAPPVNASHPFSLRLSQWFPVIIAMGVWLLALLLFSAAPVVVAPVLGPLAVLIVGIGSWIPIGSLLTYVATVFRIPLIFIILLCAFVFTAFDLNDNHAVRTISSGTPPRTFSLNEYFDGWLKSRPDLHTNNYPVFLVATEGGGIRAAYNTAMVLGGIQEKFPSFYDHLFAVSGVSGGSVGATIFSVATKESSGSTTNSYHRFIRHVFTRDLLSPLLSMGMFPDLLQRFLPFPLRFNSWDRARGLERAFENATEYKGVDLLTNSFFSWHAPRNGKLGPALLLNSTEVATGQRMTISPFDHSTYGLSRPLSLSDVSDNADLSLSSAMIVSARFPIFTPPGFFFNSRMAQKHRFVDGGFYENSGAATILDLFSSLKTNATARHCEFYIIRIGHELSPVATPTTTNTTQSLPKHHTQGFDELGPLFAIFNVREARGDDAVRQLSDAYRFLYGGAKVIGFEWKEESVPIPLGWFISRPACESLDDQFQRQIKSLKLISNALTKPVP